MNTQTTAIGGDREQWIERAVADINDEMPWLRGAARNIAPTYYDPEDLLSEAITRFIAAAKAPDFQVDNVRSYIAATMRHLAADFVRSPRSRTDPQGEEFFTELEQHAVDLTEEHRNIELHAEYALVQQAFAELPADDQTLLTEMVVKGRGAAEVAAELDLTPQNASVKLFRAKSALRRLVLAQYLRRGSNECAENAEKIRGEIHDDVEAHSPRAHGIRHVHSCEDCRRNWGAFAMMSQALGVAGLVTVASGLTTGAPASGTAAQQSPAPMTAATVAAATAIPVTATVAPATVVTPAQAPSRLIRALTGKASLVTGVACVALAAVAFGAHVLGPEAFPQLANNEPAPLAAEDALDAWFDVSSTAQGDTATLDVDFGVADVDWWQVHEVTVTLPAGARLIAAPAGLVCAGTVGVVTCDGQAENWSGGVFTIQRGAAGDELEEYHLQLEALSVRDIEVKGEASASS